jgi:hypothetical protein
VRRFQLGHGVLQLGQGAEGVAQARQVTRARIAQADTREDALDVADFLELRLQLFEAVAVEQAADRVWRALQHGQVAQRAVQPAGQQAAAHGGLATVDHRLQGVVAAAGQVGVQLQVAAAGAIEDDGVVQALMAQAAQVGQGGALGFLA